MWYHWWHRGGSGGSGRVLNPPEAGETGFWTSTDRLYFFPCVEHVIFPPRASLLISTLDGRAWAFWMQQHPIPRTGWVVEHPQGGMGG